MSNLTLKDKLKNDSLKIGDMFYLGPNNLAYIVEDFHHKKYYFHYIDRLSAGTVSTDYPITLTRDDVARWTYLGNIHQEIAELGAAIAKLIAKR